MNRSGHPSRFMSVVTTVHPFEGWATPAAAARSTAWETVTAGVAGGAVGGDPRRRGGGEPGSPSPSEPASAPRETSGPAAAAPLPEQRVSTSVCPAPTPAAHSLLVPGTRAIPSRVLVRPVW